MSIFGLDLCQSGDEVQGKVASFPSRLNLERVQACVGLFGSVTFHITFHNLDDTFTKN